MQVPTLNDIPTSAELQGLMIECYCIITVYVVALVFATYNIIVFVIMQRKYKNWLISIFYLLTLIVLISRMIQYWF